MKWNGMLCEEILFVKKENIFRKKEKVFLSCILFFESLNRGKGGSTMCYIITHLYYFSTINTAKEHELTSNRACWLP